MRVASDSLQHVDGLRLRLRLVVANDAAFIHGLRRDPDLSAHLSEVRGTVEDQRDWIANYKDREAVGSEFYYVIERLSDGVRCGVVRLYQIESDRLTWGSWILNGEKPKKAALESALLSFGVVFEQLKKTCIHIDVRRENSRALAFYRRFGFNERFADDRNIYFDYTRSQFERDRPAHVEALTKRGGI